MYRIIIIALLILTSLSCFADPDMDDPRHIRAELDNLRSLAAIEGMTVGFQFGQKSPYDIQLGIANSEKGITVDSTTIFQAASLSKPVLSLIVLKMVERDEISLDTPLYTILENPRIENTEWARLITPRLILSHQTGLPNWGQDNLKFNFQPGTAYNYSGEGYVYLQQTIEKLTGLSYQALAEKEVFKPLGMVNSYFTLDKSQTLTLALGHDRAGVQSESNFPSANAAASLHTTASDFMKFIAAWFDDEFLSPESRKIAFSAMTDTTNYKKDITNISWGLGWGLYEAENTTYAWHWGDNRIFRAFVAIDINTGNGFVYFTNSENGLAISKQMMELFFPGDGGIDAWLGYGQADSDVWQAERRGYVYASKGDYKKAINELNVVLGTYPNNNRIKNKIAWLKPIAEKRPASISLSNDFLDKVVGHYGERKLFVEGGVLMYQRGEGQKSSLTPLYDQFFKVGELDFFRLEVVFDSEGKPVKVVGHYEGGYKDESERSND